MLLHRILLLFLRATSARLSLKVFDRLSYVEVALDDGHDMRQHPDSERRVKRPLDKSFCAATPPRPHLRRLGRSRVARISSTSQASGDILQVALPLEPPLTYRPHIIVVTHQATP